MDDLSFGQPEKELNAADLLLAVINRLPIGIEVLKAVRKNEEISDLVYIIVNDAAKKQGTAVEKMGKSFLQDDDQNKKRFAQMLQVLKSGEPKDFIISPNDGNNQNWCMENYVKFDDGILICRQDITQIKLGEIEKIKDLNQSLILKNQELEVLNNEIKTFNLVAAHDYKDTLQQLYTNLEYIISKDARQLSEAGKANIRRAQSAIQKMNLLTDDINMYFNLYDMKVELAPIDPNPLIDLAINKLRSRLDQCNGKIETNEFPLIPSHPQLFSQLLANLLDNSIKFRNILVDQSISIKFSKPDGAKSINGLKPGQSYGLVSITDNGLGFDEKESGKIFDLFYRGVNNAKYRGSGIGLSVCKKIMALHGGFITADGVPEKGATIHCYFPMDK